MQEPIPQNDEVSGLTLENLQRTYEMVLNQALTPPNEARVRMEIEEHRRQLERAQHEALLAREQEVLQANPLVQTTQTAWQHLTDTNQWFLTNPAQTNITATARADANTFWQRPAATESIELDGVPQFNINRPTEQRYNRGEDFSMESIETMFKKLIAHDVSSGGRIFLNDSLHMRKRMEENFTHVTLSSAAEQTRAMPRGTAIVSGTPLIVLFFDGTFIFDDRIAFYVSSRSNELIIESVNRHFSERTLEPLEGFRGFCRRTMHIRPVHKPFMPAKKGESFSEFLARKHGSERI